MREAWTDEQLDDLAGRMDRGFDRVDADLREVKEEMRVEFRSVRTELGEIQRSLVVSRRTTLLGFLTVVGAILATQL